MHTTTRTSEHGGSRLKFLIVVAVIGIVGYIGYVVIPVKYQEYLLKDLMQHNADVAATQGYPPTWATEQLAKAAAEYGVPPDAEITSLREDNRVIVRIHYKRALEFPGYTYPYEFDHTVKSTAFLTFK